MGLLCRKLDLLVISVLSALDRIIDSLDWIMACSRIVDLSARDLSIVFLDRTMSSLENSTDCPLDIMIASSRRF